MKKRCKTYEYHNANADGDGTENAVISSPAFINVYTDSKPFNKYKIIDMWTHKYLL